jgi:hypothetical protein
VHRQQPFASRHLAAAARIHVALDVLGLVHRAIALLDLRPGKARRLASRALAAHQPPERNRLQVRDRFAFNPK